MSAFLLDEALGVRLLVDRADAQKKATKRKKDKLPDGLIYAPESMYPPDPPGPLATPHPELVN